MKPRTRSRPARCWPRYETPTSEAPGWSRSARPPSPWPRPACSTAPATTHWQVTDKLQRQYPLVDVLPNRVYVDDGDILTSAGVTAGIDLCLHLIRRDNGAAAANRRARALVAPQQRPGGQAQYVERLLPEASGDQLAPLRTWLLGHLTESIDLDTIAGSAGMSRRTLVRRFREETGTSPMAWLTDARLDRVRELLELTDEPVENLGRLTGLGSPASVRAIFRRRLGTSTPRVPGDVP